MNTTLSQANQLLRQRRYSAALALYAQSLQERPELAHIIRFNMALAERRRLLWPEDETVTPTNALSEAGAQQKPELEKPGGMDDHFFDLVRDSGLFDPAWYLAQYGEKYGFIGNPLAHYLAHGVTLSTKPSPEFDTAFYLRTNPDVAACDLHPFLHYLCQGHKEGRRPTPPLSQGDLEVYQVEEACYVPRLPPDAPPVEKTVRVIAFYLPQFHAIPENDEWWGNGFTEWTNVRPAKPQFKGHYQPHVPDEFLGYYDLRETGVMHKQIELAKQYGIEGFCFYIYWFSGKRLLERPVDNYLADPALDHPFCICWANENWSRRWDGSEHEILMGQDYSDEHDLEFIADMAKYLRDPRYIRVDGKPLFIVYRPNLFPDMAKTAGRWRQWCRENGIGELLIAYVQSFDDSPPEKYGLDAAIEFPPSGWYARPEAIVDIEPYPRFSGKLLEWRYLVKRSNSYETADPWIFRGVCPSWDNTARRKGAATIFHRNSPKLFKRWLLNAFTDTRKRIRQPDKRLVFINAWNEWAEGAHLEPDQRYGYAWLDAVRDSHQICSRPRIAIVTHDAFPAGAQLLCLHMARYLTDCFGFHVHLVSLGKGKLLRQYAEKCTLDYIPIEDLELKATQAFASALRTKGVSLALVNTAASGKMIPVLNSVGITCISLVHELPWILSRYRLQEHIKTIAKHASKIVFAAPQVKAGFESFLGHEVSQAVIRPQGLYQRSWLRAGADKGQTRRNVRQQLGIPVDSEIVICVGYADHRKGFDLFVEIGVRLMQQRPDVYFLWVGQREEGFVENNLAVADRAGLCSRFLFTGLVEEPQPYYLAADIYALTSREDPFPSVVMEALDALTPAVAFQDSGGFEELLRRGCGVLVPKEDVAAFAEALERLLDEPAKAQAMAQTGRAIVERELNFRHYLFDLLELGGQPFPRVTVIVPNYNYARYLLDRLRTVTAQSLPLYELFVLDDCSPDDSVKLASEFLKQCDVPWRMEVNAANSGYVFKQWIKGLEMARGEYVWIAEADDTCSPHFLEKLVSRMRETGAAFGFCDSWQIDEEGNRLGESYKPYVSEGAPGAFDQSFVMEGREFLEKHLAIKNVILNVSGVVFQRNALLAALNKIGVELFQFKVAGDWRIYIELCASGRKVVYEADVLNGHRRHRTSVTHALEVRRHLKEIEAMHEIIGKMLADDEVKKCQGRYLQRVEQYLLETA